MRSRLPLSLCKYSSALCHDHGHVPRSTRPRPLPTPQLPLASLTSFDFDLHVYLHTKMIRRDPTLIQMTDSDVQDIREFVAARKREEAGQQDAEMSKENTNVPVPGFTTQEEAQKKKEAMTKHERLGIA